MFCLFVKVVCQSTTFLVTQFHRHRRESVQNVWQSTLKLQLELNMVNCLNNFQFCIISILSFISFEQRDQLNCQIVIDSSSCFVWTVMYAKCLAEEKTRQRYELRERNSDLRLQVYELEKRSQLLSQSLQVRPVTCLETEETQFNFDSLFWFLVSVLECP